MFVLVFLFCLFPLPVASLADNWITASRACALSRQWSYGSVDNDFNDTECGHSCSADDGDASGTHTDPRSEEYQREVADKQRYDDGTLTGMVGRAFSHGMHVVASLSPSPSPPAALRSPTGTALLSSPPALDQGRATPEVQ